MQNLSEVRLSRSHILSNLSTLRSLLGGGRISAAVKANAYGHGLQEMVHALGDKVDSFQVDDFDELLRIRSYTKSPVLVLGYVPPQLLSEAFQLGAELGVFSVDQLLEINEITKSLPETVGIHLAIDSLFGREGFLPSEVPHIVEVLRANPKIEVRGVYSHYSSSDSYPPLEISHRQRQCFRGVLVELAAAGVSCSQPHIAASGGAFAGLVEADEMARLGLSLYGMWPSPDFKQRFAQQYPLRPVMEVVTQVAQVKFMPPQHPIGYSATYFTSVGTKVALLPLGYSDGIDRRCGGRTDVLVNGQRCRLVGRVSMNMCVAEVGHLSEIKAGDEVVFLGQQQGCEIDADEIAFATNRINYEITTTVSPLLPRRLVD